MTTDIHALVGAYALDAVDDLERVAFDRHLAECESCRHEVDELLQTAGRLADNTWSVPPPRLRSEVLAAIGRTRQLPPGESVRRDPDSRAAVSRWRRFTAGAAAAAVLATGAGATAWVVQEQRVRDAAETAQRTEARTRSILAAPDVVFRTGLAVGGGKVTVAASQLRDAGVVLVGTDRALTSEQALQFWTIRDGGPPVSAGVLPAGQGSATRVVDGLPGTDVFAVSLEPAGGSAQPTQVLAQVDLV